MFWGWGERDIGHFIRYPLGSVSLKLFHLLKDQSHKFLPKGMDLLRSLLPDWLAQRR